MDHSSIVNDFGSTSGLEWEAKDPKTVINFGNIGVNYDLIETMGIQIAEGRSFSRQLSSDSSEIILNEAAINAMGIKNPVGKTIKMWGVDRKIVGIVKNFHFESIHENIKPFALRLEPMLTHRIIAKIKAGTEKETLDRLQRLYKEINPGFSFNYKFMDQDYQALYVGENRVATLSKYFAGLAIIISCLGLFGLAAFTAQKKQKEIGIRKVVGASVSNIAAMLSKDFLKLVLIAILVAFPLSWWAMNQWLNNFAYRIDIGAGVFFIAGASIIFITLLTISFQAIKAAIANPVKSLRTE
jgi:putative ABC transport system permease protein